MNQREIKRLAVAALMLALTYVLPFFTGGIPAVGNLLLPMHLPVLLCGFLCGGPWGAAVGLIAPLLRSALLGMPPMFPIAVSMSFELATYGAVAGILYRRLPHSVGGVYASLGTAMVCGRLVWGAVRAVLTFVSPTPFGLAAFVAGALTNAIPGILLQLLLIPILVFALQKTKLSCVL